MVVEITTASFPEFALCYGGTCGQMQKIDVPAVSGAWQASQDADSSLENPRRVLLEDPREELWYRNSRRSSGKGRPLRFAWPFNLESTAVRNAAGV